MQHEPVRPLFALTGVAQACFVVVVIPARSTSSASGVSLFKRAEALLTDRRAPSRPSGSATSAPVRTRTDVAVAGSIPSATTARTPRERSDSRLRKTAEDKNRGVAAATDPRRMYGGGPGSLRAARGSFAPGTTGARKPLLPAGTGRLSARCRSAVQTRSSSAAFASAGVESERRATVSLVGQQGPSPPRSTRASRQMASKW